MDRSVIIRPAQGVHRVGLYTVAWAALGMILLSGCTSIGSHVVATERYQYNLALQRAEDQQLLLNLVRLRYRDRPYFLETGSLATQFSISPQLGLVGALGSPSIEQDLLISGGVGVEEQPTVTYVPLQGEDFARRMLRPIPLENIVLLANSGWSIERILRLVVQQINQLENARSAAGPTPMVAPEFEGFLRAARLLRSLQQERLVEFGFNAETNAPVLQVSAQGADSDAYRELAALLQLDADRRTYQFTCELQDPCRDLSVQMRSLTGVLNYLSQAVVISAEDEQAGRVTVTLDRDGRTFDWGRVTEGLFRIAVSQSKPETAAVAVKYRNQWFYIDDSDLSSKSTFMLVGELFSLVAVEGQGDAPVLTLPLGN